MALGSETAAFFGAAGAAASGGGYTIDRSLRFNSADSAFLSRTPASAGNRKTWTWAGWVKRSKLGVLQLIQSVEAAATPTQRLIFYFDGSDRLCVDCDSSWRATTQNLRDTSAWYHIVIAMDTTQATANDRIKIYINGVQVTSFASTANPAQNADTGVNNSSAHNIGRNLATASYYLDAYLADVYLIDGQALDPTSFGEFDTNGVWQPIEYTGSYGTNGFHLDFADNSTAAALGYDAAGSNDWTVNNLSVTAGAGNDSLVDTPTSYGTDTGAGGEVRGNYCTLNPLDKNANCTLSNGNLDFSTGTADYGLTRATFGMSSGKWYWEITPTTGAGSANFFGCGIAKANASLATYLGDTNSWSYFSGGSKYGNGSGATAYGAQYENNDVIGVAFDADNGTLTFYRNGTSQGQAFSGLTSGPYFPAVSDGGTSGSASGVTNFGQRPFAYQTAGTNRPAATYLALCTANLPEPTIADGSTAMDVVLWTGNNTDDRVITTNFSPEFLWVKRRDSSSSHRLTDVVRGNGKILYSELTDAEATETTTIKSLGSTGFTLGTSVGVNATSGTYVGWYWDGGSSTVTNTDGSISSQVRANASAGFSIVTYTGTGSSASVGHGLGVAPAFYVTKRRDSSSFGNWTVYHSSIGTQFLELNGTGAAGTDANRWSSAATSTVFNIGSGGNVNVSGGTFVAYCFAPVAGYSAFGSYTGNGSTDGPFVYTGFRPKFILGKVSSTTDGWYIFDATRSPYNVTDKYFAANASAAEATFTFADFLSNGFKLRATTSDWNTSGQTYIFAAFAEHPFQTARAR